MPKPPLMTITCCGTATSLWIRPCWSRVISCSFCDLQPTDHAVFWLGRKILILLQLFNSSRHREGHRSVRDLLNNIGGACRSLTGALLISTSSSISMTSSHQFQLDAINDSEETSSDFVLNKICETSKYLSSMVMDYRYLENRKAGLLLHAGFG